MKSSGTRNVTLFTLLSFGAYYFLFAHFEAIKLLLDKITRYGLISYVLTYLIIGIPIFIGTFIINRNAGIFKSLGLSASISTAIWTSLLFTIPMFIGGVLFFRFNPKIDMENLLPRLLLQNLVES